MPPESEQALRQRNREVVAAFFASRLDQPGERIALWHPNGVKELPFAPRGLPMTRWEGRDAIAANTVANTRIFANCRHRDVEIHETEDPALFFVTSRMVPEATFLGEPYPQSFVHLMRVQDGAVILQREYFNAEILSDAEHAARAKGRLPSG